MKNCQNLRLINLENLERMGLKLISSVHELYWYIPASRTSFSHSQNILMTFRIFGCVLPFLSTLKTPPCIKSVPYISSSVNDNPDAELHKITAKNKNVKSHQNFGLGGGSGGWRINVIKLV